MSSKYTVLSQSQVEGGEDVDDVVYLAVNDDDMDTTCVQSANEYNDGMPMYKEICKMANASGHNSCRNIILRDMNTIRREYDGATAEPRKCS